MSIIILGIISPYFIIFPFIIISPPVGPAIFNNIPIIIIDIFKNIFFVLSSFFFIIHYDFGGVKMDFSVPTDINRVFYRAYRIIDAAVPGSVQYAFLPFVVIILLILIFRNTR